MLFEIFFSRVEVIALYVHVVVIEKRRNLKKYGSSENVAVLDPPLPLTLDTQSRVLSSAALSLRKSLYARHDKCFRRIPQLRHGAKGQQNS